MNDPRTRKATRKDTMTPTWESPCKTVKLWLADCEPMLVALPAIGATVTDPPYGIGINKSHRLSTSRGFGGETWDDKPASATVIGWICGNGKPAIIWGGNYFDLPPTRCVLTWDKINDGRDFADFEMAWTNLDAVARTFRKRPMNMDGGKEHPTQKPIDLMVWCLKQLPETTEPILDCYMGSGSTGVACARLGIPFFGIERDADHFATAQRRISDELIKKTGNYKANPAKYPLLALEGEE